jgi:hypothetical protein
MDKYEYIKKEWIVSRGARRVYRFSAFLSLTLLLWPWVADASATSEVAASIATALLLAGILGYVTSQAAMEIFLFRFDSSHALKQIFWFCVLLVPVLGAALYVFLVYSRSTVLSKADKQRAEAVQMH